MAEKKKLITKDMTLGDAVSRHPATADVMMGFGLHCIGCAVAAWESIEEGAKVHGITGKKLEEMLEKMNKAAEESEKHKSPQL